MDNDAENRELRPPDSDGLRKAGDSKRAGFLAVVGAAGAGALMSFSLTHNPLFQALIVPGIITFFAGPFLGGYNSGTRVRVGPLEALVVGLVIGLVNAVPVGAVWLILTIWPTLLPDPAFTIQVRTVVGWVAVAFGVYGGVTAFAGALVAARRQARTRGIPSVDLEGPA